MQKRKCRLCGSKSSYIESEQLKEDYYHCPECDLIFIAEENIVSKKEEKKRYEEHDNTHENEGYVQMFEDFITKAVAPFVTLNDNVYGLEFGCGPGPVLADLLSDRGARVDIYDPYFFPDESYRESKYDFITSTEVFEHFLRPYKEIAELKESLKTEGILAIMTHFHKQKEEDFEIEDWWYKWDKTHITFYSHKTMKWIAKEFDFDILYMDNKKLCVFKNQ